jgi:hypothetical protein
MDHTSSEGESFAEVIKPAPPPEDTRDYSVDQFIPLSELHPISLPSCRCRISDDISVPPPVLVVDSDDDMPLVSPADPKTITVIAGSANLAAGPHDPLKKKKKTKKTASKTGSKRVHHAGHHHKKEPPPAGPSADSPVRESSQQSSRSASRKRRQKVSGSSIAVSRELKIHYQKEKNLPAIPPDTPTIGSRSPR